MTERAANAKATVNAMHFIADKIVECDGNCYPKDISRLTCEETQAIARLLKLAALYITKLEGEQ